MIAKFPMPLIMERLRHALPSPTGYTALELFVRDGSMSTANWAPLFEHLTGVDINNYYLDQFEKNFPHAEAIKADVPNGLLYDQEFCNRLQNRFDLVSADNPCGLYGCNEKNSKPFCEHFEFIDILPSLCKPGGFILFPVNLNPYFPGDTKGALDNYGMTDATYYHWRRRRRGLYKRDDVKLTPMWVATFYTKLFRNKLQFVAYDLRNDNIPGREPHLAHFLFRCTA